MINTPIFKIEIEGLRHQVSHMLGLHTQGFHDAVKQAIGDLISPEYIEARIRSAALKVFDEKIDEVMEKEIEAFFEDKARDIISKMLKA